MSEQIWWYIARSGGIVALALSGLSVIWGLLVGTKLLQGRPGPRWLLDLHKWLGGSAVVFTIIHVGALMLDPFVSFGLFDVLIPGASSWNPAAVAWGVVSGWLLIAVQVTSLLMKRIPKRLWKLVHMTSYGMLWTGVLHGARAGTDSGDPLYVVGVALMVLTVVFLTAYRILTARRGSRRSIDSAEPRARLLS